MKRLIICLVSVVLFTCFISCQKEVSLEYGSEAKGSLQSTVGECLPKTVGGAYIVNKGLTDSNFIEVTVNVTSPGPYLIFTDSLNGYSFKATGTFATTGSNTVRLKGTGNPASQGVNNFTVYFDSSRCDIAVTVLPAGSSGVASFSMVCTSFVPSGNYYKDTTLNAFNTVAVQVNVTAIGTYSITTNTINGYSFSKSGTFTSTAGNPQTVVLQGVGKPAAVGTNNFIATAGGSGGTCNFTVAVVAGSGSSCTPPTIQGSYVTGTALATSNKAIFSHTYATNGSFTVSTNSVNGYSFTSLSVSATAGTPLTITLTGTGNPTAAGADNFNVNFGDGTTCPFTVTVMPAPNNDYFPLTANSYWTYNYDTGVADTFKVMNSGPTAVFNGNTYQRFVYMNNVADDEFYRKDAAGAYYQSIDTAGFGGVFGFTFTQPRLDMLFLKNTLATGDSLVSNFNSAADTGGGTPVIGVFRIKYKVVDANLSKTINGKNFTNVYQLKLNFEFGYMGNFINLSSTPQMFYYAKGVGLIRWDDGSTPPTNFQDIRYWQVN